GEWGGGHAGKEVTLAGWVARRRDHGGVIFIDLRDASGYVQVVFREEQAHHLRAEYCIKVEGTITPRPAGNENPDLPTGEIEVTASALTVLSEAAPLPFPVDGGGGRRGRPVQAPVPRPAPGRAGQRAAAALGGQPDRPPGAGRGRVHRGGDPVPDPLHPGGGPGLPGAGAAAAGQLVRPAAVAAA